MKKSTKEGRLADDPNMQFKIKMIGFITECNFYIPNNGDDTGMTFRMAYYRAAKYSMNNKQFSTYVGSMLCSVVPAFRNFVETTLNAIGVKPRFVSLSSQAHENDIDISNAPQLEWPSILVMFGYCILLLFKLDFKETTSYDNYISNCIRGLQTKVRWNPGNKLDIPFDATKAKAVTTMLGSNDLCETVKKFLRSTSHHPDRQICDLCQYLSLILY